MKVEPMSKEEVQQFIAEELRKDFIHSIIRREAKHNLPFWYNTIIDCSVCPFDEECDHEGCKEHIKNYIAKGDINYEHKS